MALINDLYLKVLTALDRDEEGQGLAEYALILALIAIVAIIALIFLDRGTAAARRHGPGGSLHQTRAGKRSTVAAEPG